MLLDRTGRQGELCQTSLEERRTLEDSVACSRTVTGQCQWPKRHLPKKGDPALSVAIALRLYIVTERIYCDTL